MSSGVKTIASIALPIVGSIVAPGIGTALGSSLAAGTLGTIGGAVGGAAGGLISGGGLKGAALGALGGAVSGPAGASIVGTPSTAATIAANGAPIPGNFGSGIAGAVTGGGTRALFAPVTQAAAGTGIANGAGGLLQSVTDDPSKLLLTIGNQLMAKEGSDTALKAAKIQSAAIDRGIAANTEAQAPYTALGQDAVNQISTIQSDPQSWLKNNSFYSSLASDAERRLLASQAAKGKVGSGGTAAALQEQLLTLGNGLVQQQLGTLQNQANIGSAAASNVGSTAASMYSQQGDVNAAGKVGSYNSYSNGYQNQINTLLALQGLQKTPTYSPTINL